MKKLLLFLFISYQSFGQIQIFGPNSSTTIRPWGIEKRYGIQPDGQRHSINLSFGAYSLNTGAGNYNVGLGHYALEKLGDGNANIAIGQGTMQYTSNAEMNIAIGFNTMSKNNGSNNLGIGTNALFNNKGKYNIAIGEDASLLNSTGGNNTALGIGALYSNTSGSFNIAIGRSAMAGSGTSSDNIAIGNSALLYNKLGTMNLASGHEALYKNTSGSYNIGLGRSSLYNNVSGNFNTAVGYQAGSNSTGSFNTFLGHNADITTGDYINATSIGYGAIVDASNKVRIGNSAISIIEGQVPWSNPSDRRLKENINYTNRLGLDFITRLKTTSYNYIADENKTRYDGFIAQDVEQTMKELGVPFSGLKKSADGTYSLAYSDFVMPLVNAVKEQQQEIEKLKAQNQALSAKLSEIDEIKAEIARMKQHGEKTFSK